MKDNRILTTVAIIIVILFFLISCLGFVFTALRHPAEAKTAMQANIQQPCIIQVIASPAPVYKDLSKDDEYMPPTQEVAVALPKQANNDVNADFTPSPNENQTEENIETATQQVTTDEEVEVPVTDITDDAPPTEAPVIVEVPIESPTQEPVNTCKNPNQWKDGTEDCNAGGGNH